MLGTDARLLTEDEEIKSHDLFSQLNSKASITGESENQQEETELKYLAEIRDIRDNNVELFARIKKLPKKARSTRACPALSEIHSVASFPSLVTYFRQGRLDKFFIAAPTGIAVELDFMKAASLLRPSEHTEKLLPIDGNFYSLLDNNRQAFFVATNEDIPMAAGKRGGGANSDYILNRLAAREIRNYHGYTEEDEAFIQQVIQILNDGALPKTTAKKVADALKKEANPLKVLCILRRDIPEALLSPTHAAQAQRTNSPREVILSSMILEAS